MIDDGSTDSTVEVARNSGVDYILQLGHNQGLARAFMAGGSDDPEKIVRDVQAPERVRNAIEEKLQREQQVAAEQFQTEIVQARAQQQIEEAKGIAEAQAIISEGLTPEYLTFFYIEQLGDLPPGSVIYVPTEGGVPLMRNIGGGQ